MSSRWPEAMRAATAAEYLDMDVTTFRRLKLPPLAPFAPRGEKRWLKSDLDHYLDDRRNAVANASGEIADPMPWR